MSSMDNTPHASSNKGLDFDCCVFSCGKKALYVVTEQCKGCNSTSTYGYCWNHMKYLPTMREDHYKRYSVETVKHEDKSSNPEHEPDSSTVEKENVEELAKKMHEIYLESAEKLDHGNPSSRVPWEDLDEKTRELDLALARWVLGNFTRKTRIEKNDHY